MNLSIDGDYIISASDFSVRAISVLVKDIFIAIVHDELAVHISGTNVELDTIDDDDADSLPDLYRFPSRAKYLSTRHSSW